MAQYSVIIDAVALSQIVNEVDKQRRAKDFVAKLAVQNSMRHLDAYGPNARATFLAAIKVLEDAGLSTTDAIATFGKLLEVSKKLREEPDNDT